MQVAAGPFTLWVLDVGLACCAVEVVAASMGAQEPPAGRPLDVIVVAGTVTDKLAPAVKALYDRLPDPKYVVSFGACANCGGPYWDSYCVTKGVDQLVPVDVYVPGCPPRPEALLDGLRTLQATVAGAAAAGTTVAGAAVAGAAVAGAAVAGAGDTGSAGREAS